MHEVDEQTIKAAIEPYAPAERYWRARRAKGPAAIHWRIDPTLLEIGAAGLARWEPAGAVIFLYRVPANLDDAATACHELEHLVLDLAGYPSLCCNPTDPPATRRLVELGNGVLDLVIDDRLRSLGFRLSPPAAGPNPFEALARGMGYQTREQMRAVMQRIVEMHPGATGLRMEADTGAFYAEELKRWESH